MIDRQIVTDERAKDLIGRADWTAAEALDLLHTREHAIRTLEEMDELIQDTAITITTRVQLAQETAAEALNELRGEPSPAEETKPSPERST